MSTTCTQCGAPIGEGQRFCNACGAPQILVAKPVPRFCVSCGHAITAGSAFCNNCGKPVTPGITQPQAAPSTPPPAPPSESIPAAPSQPVTTSPDAQAASPDLQEPTPPTQTPAAPVESFATTAPVAASVPIAAPVPPTIVAPPVAQTTTSGGKGCITALIITLVVLATIAIVVIAGMIYVAHKVKNKVEEFATKEMQHAQDTLSQTHINTAVDMSDVPGSFPSNSRPAENCPDANASADASGSAPRIPLKEGLTWVNAWRRFNGDVEILYKVDSIAPNAIGVTSSGLGFSDSRAVKGNQIHTHRLICRTDLQDASIYITENRDTYPPIIPQTTTFSMSRKSLQELKTTGKFTITYEELIYAGNRTVPVPQTAEMKRVEPEDVNYPVILNGQPTNVPVIHARGHFHFTGSDKVKKLYKDTSFFDEDGEVFVLDDPVNPVTLLWSMGPIFQIRVTSITYPEEKPKPQIEDQLAKQKKAVVYGIYFDFNQATIKKESEPVLKEIADAMKANPDWVLTVNGYTDNIGGDAYNVDLSKRRAASVKKALVEQYGIAEARLTTGGFGASSPVDTNETLEGRARNRRVELIRQ